MCFGREFEEAKGNRLWGIIPPLVRGMMMDLHDMASSRTINVYNVDSLAAVDIKVWTTKGVRIVVHASNVLEGLAMACLPGKIVEKSSLVVS